MGLRCQGLKKGSVVWFVSCLLGAGFTFQFRHWFRIVLVFLGSYVPQAGFQVLQGQSFNFERELLVVTSKATFNFSRTLSILCQSVWIRCRPALKLYLAHRARPTKGTNTVFLEGFAVLGSWTATGQVLDSWVATGQIWIRIFWQLGHTLGLKPMQNKDRMLHHYVWIRQEGHQQQI